LGKRFLVTFKRAWAGGLGRAAARGGRARCRAGRARRRAGREGALPRGAGGRAPRGRVYGS